MVVNAAQLASYSQAKQLVLSTGITYTFIIIIIIIISTAILSEVWFENMPFICVLFSLSALLHDYYFLSVFV